MDSRNTYKDKNPFVVPECYFEQLSDRVMQRVKREERSVLRRVRPFLKWVAVFVIGVTGVWMAYTASFSHGDDWKANVDQHFTIESGDESIFDSQFNPTCDEIIEYLVTEVDDYEMLLAGNY